MTTLKNWTVRRSGAGMTVFGVDANTGKDVKISNIKNIEPSDNADHFPIRAVLALEQPPEGKFLTHILLVGPASL